MALVVEDGTGLSNSESYISEADADTYIAANYVSGDTAVYDALSSGDKEIIARQATRYLDGKYRWRGRTEKAKSTASDDPQALDWPRLGVVDELGVEYDGLPQQLVDATAEVMRLLGEGTTINVDVTRNSQVRKTKVDVIEVEYEPSATQQPSFPVVNRLVGELILPGGQTVRG